MPLPSPSYTPQLLTSLDRTITRERLHRYLVATNQDLAGSIQLYEHNVILSEVLYGLLHGLEIAVRNAIHHALMISYNVADWYDHAPLSSYWQDQLSNAKDKLRKTIGQPPPAGNVIAELTFGFWVDLLSKRNHNTLWMGKKLRTAFPHAKVQRDAIHQRLKVVQHLRNRISHHERILTSRSILYTSDRDITLAELIECVQWVCPETAQWITTRFRYNEAQNILATVAATGNYL